MNLESFEVTTAVVHDVPHGGREDEPLVLTDAPIELDDALRAYFRSKIIKSLGLRGVDVVVDPDGAPCVRDMVAGVLAAPDHLVETSKRAAEHLHAVQTGRNSAGLLTIVLGRIDGRDCVAVLKLEREQGLRFKIDTDAEDHKTVDLELLRELTLTDKTKVFKTSLFLLDDAGGPASMHGRVSDNQRGRDDGVGVATFYLSTFLGCRLKDQPRDGHAGVRPRCGALYQHACWQPRKTQALPGRAARQDAGQHARRSPTRLRRRQPRRCRPRPLQRGDAHCRNRPERRLRKGHLAGQSQGLQDALRLGHGVGR